jgi:hypothetical protein
MFVLHIGLKVKPGEPQELEKTYAESFAPRSPLKRVFRQSNSYDPTTMRRTIASASPSIAKRPSKNGWQLIFINKCGLSSKIYARNIQ